MDKFFTNIFLAEKLLAEDLTVAATLHKTKLEIPVILKPSKTKEIYSYKLASKNNLTMVSYVPNKEKAVIFLRTMRNDQVYMMDQKRAHFSQQ